MSLQRSMLRAMSRPSALEKLVLGPKAPRGAKGVKHFQRKFARAYGYARFVTDLLCRAAGHTSTTGVLVRKRIPTQREVRIALATGHVGNKGITMEDLQRGAA